MPEGRGFTLNSVRSVQMAVLQNIGSAKSPVNLGQGLWPFKRNGHWLYRDSQNQAPFRAKQVQRSHRPRIDVGTLEEGLCSSLSPHECVDRPNLPCPACERDGLRALGILQICV